MMRLLDLRPRHYRNPLPRVLFSLIESPIQTTLLGHPPKDNKQNVVVYDLGSVEECADGGWVEEAIQE